MQYNYNSLRHDEKEVNDSPPFFIEVTVYVKRLKPSNDLNVETFNSHPHPAKRRTHPNLKLETLNLKLETLNPSNDSNVETSSSFFFLDKKEAKNQGCRKIG